MAPELPASLRQGLAREGAGLTILVLRLSALGDVLRTLPAVRLLRRGLPAAGIHWVVEDRFRIAVEGHIDLSRVLTVPRNSWRQSARSLRGWIEIARSVAGVRSELRGLRPNLVLDFHGNLRSGVLGRLSGAPVRLGYAGHQQKEGNRWLTTHRVPSGSRRTPRMDRNLDLLRALGLPDRPLPNAAPPFVARGHAGAATLLGELGLARTAFAVVSPGASRAQQRKKPPAELLAAGCDRLSTRGVVPLVVWGPGEEQDARAVVASCQGGALLAPPTDLPLLGALLEEARIFLGGDSGPLHLACAVECPVVAIYGPTDPQVNQPWGVPFQAVSPPDRHYTGIKRVDRNAGGFSGLRRGDVEEAVDRLLAAAAGSRQGTERLQPNR